MTRTTWGAWAVALATALGIAASAAPSAAASGDPASGDPTTLLAGQLIRVERPHLESPDARTEAAHVRALPAGSDEDTDGDGDDDDPAHSTPMLVVGSQVVPLAAAPVAAVPTGARVTVEVPVPAKVVAAARTGRALPTGSRLHTSAVVTPRAVAAARTAPAAAGSTLAQVTAAAAAASTTPVQADVHGTAQAAQLASSAAQQVSVAVVDYRGQANSDTDADVTDLLSGASSYWSEQTGGAVSFALHGTIARYATSIPCSNLNGLWSEAATKTGFTLTADAHLLVVLPESAYRSGCPLGVGSVSSGVHGGGYVAITSTGTSALAHEIGHNLSLKHAGRLYCGTVADKVANKGCSTVEYGDMPDVMGYATNLPAIGNASAVALGRLGVLAPTDQVAVTSTGEATVTLQPLSAFSGIRSAVVTDPRSGDVYYLENRQALGRDRNGWGVWGAMAYGVRVLKLAPDGRTLVLDPTPHATSARDTDVVITPGTTFKTAADGVEVRTVQNSDGSVDAKLSLAAVGDQHFPSSLVATTIGASATSAPLASTASLPLTVTAADGSAVNGTLTATEAGTKAVSVRISGGKGTLKVAGRAIGAHTFALAFKPTTSTKSPSPLRYGSGSVVLTVTTIPSTLTAKVPAKKPTVLDAAVLPVTVAAKGATATGTVTASEGGTVLATGTLARGAAKLTLPALTAGDHPLALAYSGDAKVAASTATAVVTAVALPVSVVTPAATSVTTTAAKAATVRVGVRVGAVAGTGTLALTEGTTSLGTATLASGSATVTLPLLTAGTHVVTITHVGPSTVTGGTATVTVTVTS